MRGASAADMTVPLRRWRFRFGCFFVRMWLLNAFRRVTLPVPVNLKRFRAARLLFCLGIVVPFSSPYVSGAPVRATSTSDPPPDCQAPSLFLRQHHGHVAALELGLGLDLGEVLQPL